MGTTALSVRVPHGGISERIIGAYYDVYNGLGYGFLETVYRRAMCVALWKRGLSVEAEIPYSVYFRGELVGEYRADILVERSVIVECKAVERLTGTHEDQVANYLRASGLSVGLLLNFGPRASIRSVTRSSPK